MSFFALLHPAGDANQPTIEECHLNLWSLGAIGPRRTMVLDVGVRLKATSSPVASVRVAIPFQSSRVTDLARMLLDTDLAELIFDSEVLRPSSDTIKYRNQEVKITRVAVLRAKREAVYSSRDFTVWDLPLTVPLSPGEEGYIRVRFAVAGTRSVWRWRRAWLVRTGAVIDFRICDIRRTVTVPSGEELRSDILPIARLAAFIIVPAWLYTRSSSPAPNYVRLLEGPVWSTYLGRAPEARSTSKLIVYSWRTDPPAGGIRKRGAAGISSQIAPSAPISISRPFRIFLDLAMEQSPLSPVRGVLYALVTVLFIFTAFRLQLRPEYRSVVADIWHFVQMIPTWLQVTSVAGIMRVIQKCRKGCSRIDLITA